MGIDLWTNALISTHFMDMNKYNLFFSCRKSDPQAEYFSVICQCPQTGVNTN